MRLRLLLVALLVPVAPSFSQTPVYGLWPGAQPAVFADLPYPADALEAREAGPVVVRVTTDATGRVTSAEPLFSRSERLAKSAVANARHWTLSPGARSEVIVYRFELEPGRCNDDSRSLFRLVRPNLAVVTACTGPRGGVASDAFDKLKFVSKAKQAEYPDLARSARLTGVVVLELSLDAMGAVVDSRPLTQLPFLTEAAVTHSKTWRFQPTSSRHGIFVYEFALDLRECRPGVVTEFWRVTTDFWRLSTCSATP